MGDIWFKFLQHTFNSARTSGTRHYDIKLVMVLIFAHVLKVNEFYDLFFFNSSRLK